MVAIHARLTVVARCTPPNSAHVGSDHGDHGGSRRARPHADQLVCEITGGQPGPRYVLDAGSHAWTQEAPRSYLAAAPKSRQVQPLLGWPVGRSSLQPSAVVSTLSWARLSRPAPAGTATLLRSTGGCLRLRSKWRAQALPEMSPAPRGRRPVSRSQAPARATSRLLPAARRKRRARTARMSR